MGVYAIAEILDNNNMVVGTRIIETETNRLADVPLDKIKGKGVKYCTNSKAKYAKIRNNELIKEGGLVVLRKTDEYIELANWKGQVLKGKISDALPALKKFGIANGFVRDNKDVVVYSVADDVKTVVGNEVKASVKNEKKVVNKVPVKKEVSDTEKKIKDFKRKRLANSFSRRLCINTGKSGRNDSASIMCDMDGTQVTLEQKLVKAQLELKKKAPFISSMLATTNVVENYSIETAGVSLDTMYFNPNFMKDLSLKVIEFTYAHEMMHLLMQHRMRQGDRDHYLWNVACDAYINKMLANDLRLLTESEVTEQGFVMITDVDLKSDTPEIIYKGLEQMQQQMQQNPLQGDNSQGSGNSQRCGSDGSDGSSDSDEDGDENGQQSSDGQSGKGNKSSEGKGNSKSNGDEEGNDDGNEDGEGSGEGQDDGEKDGQGNSKGKGKKGKGQRKVKYKGKEVKNCDSDKISEDMVDDEKSQSMSDTTLKERSKAVVERAKVYNDTVGNRQVGSGEGGLLREVEKALAPKVNWFPLVRNRLTKATNTIYTYSSPDKRFLGRKMIMPGPKKLTEDALENVLIAIDTSGSISNKDLGQFFKMFESLIKKFKANGEVMYWGSEVEAVYKFNNWKELVKTKPVGGGGTDINCVYQYLEGRDFKIGKKKKPIMILVVTDGYFGNVEKKYEKWRKETVWLLAPDCYENFKEPFGTKAILKGEDEV